MAKSLVMTVQFKDEDDTIKSINSNNPELYTIIKELFIEGDLYDIKLAQLSIDTVGNETLEVLVKIQ